MHAFIKRLKNRLFAANAESPQEIRGKWSIGIYTGSSPFVFQADATLVNPVLTAADVNDAPANFVADPFMIRDGSTWYMFFEVDTFCDGGTIGKIGMASSNDGFQWNYRRIVLETLFHLSYPYVFKWEDDYYMIPETRSIRAVQLYRAQKFPMGWQLEKTLLKGRRFADSSVFRYRDRWWMFTDSGNTTLRLYSANELKGRWTEHPESPIVKKNPSIARPAGRVTAIDDDLIRYAQDCYPHYGKQVWAFRITELTATSYKEEKWPMPVIQASESGWNRSGMHTIDPHRLQADHWMACVDGFGDDDRK